MKFQWVYNNKISNLPLSEQIKINRDYKSDLSLALSDYAPLELLADLEKAAKKILESIDKKIIIFGHDDPDGITSTYILYDFLKKLGSKQISYYIPNREIEHYGIQKPLIDKIITEKINLLITVDNGIASYDAIKFLKDNNVQTIVTDHHLIPNKIPPAYAVVNPKREDSRYPDKYLAGVGVAYILLLKIASLIQIPISKNYLFWAALGTLADRVPLKKANRIIIKEAFSQWDMFNDQLLFLVDSKFQTYRNAAEKQDLMEFLIPILHNGRDRNGEHKALKMILADFEEKKSIYQTLLLQKMEYEARRAKVDKLLEHIFQKAEKYFIFIDSENKVPFDLAGYFTSYIADRNFIPVLILKNKHGDVWACEARATQGFNLIDAFKYCHNLLLQYGGHAQAAGFTILQKNISAFLEKFKDYIKNYKKNESPKKFIKIDAVCNCNKQSAKEFLSEDLNWLYPFGQDFPFPTVLLKNFRLMPQLQSDFNLENFNPIDNDKIYDIVISLKKNTVKLIDFSEIENEKSKIST